MPVAAACLLLAACPRVYPEGMDPQAKVTGSHPWDAPDYKGPKLRQQQKADEDVQQVAGGGQTLTRPEHGPALPDQDSIDEKKLEGWWIVTCVTSDEKLFLLPVSEQDTFIFQSGHDVIYHSISNWKDSMQQGSYKKLKPGVLGLKFGSESEYAQMYGQLFEDDFLYIWNYEQKAGFWMARLPKQTTERLGANHFDTTRGELTINDVVGTSFTGKVKEGEGRSMGISGFYNRGIISVRWEESDRTGTGYAMFIAGPDWKTLKGTWWIDDYEAAPFSDAWNGTRK
jgi:hypothetical protein